MIHKTSRSNTFSLCNTVLYLDHILFSYTLELKRGRSALMCSVYCIAVFPIRMFRPPVGRFPAHFCQHRTFPHPHPALSVSVNCRQHETWQTENI